MSRRKKKGGKIGNMSSPGIKGEKVKKGSQ